MRLSERKELNTILRSHLSSSLSIYIYISLQRKADDL